MATRLPTTATMAQADAHGHEHANDHTHADGHAHAHHRAHDHAHHARHAHRATSHALWLGFALTAGFAALEALAGWISGSLALISDAGHMATDGAAFVVALIAQTLARRPPSTHASYGYQRAEVLAAFVNALAMLALVVWIAVEAVARLLAPIAVAGTIVIAVAAVGMAVNVAVAWILSRAASTSINARGALLHVVGDLLGSVAALVAGAVVYFTGWTPIDPILSIVVALLILRSTFALLRQSAGVLMERVPSHLSYDAIGRALAAIPGVSGVHDLHVWQMDADRPAMSAHVMLADGATWPRVLAAAQRLLARDFGIDHVTLQPSWPVEAPTRRRVPVPVVPDRGRDDASRDGPTRRKR
jgi:cobalt-zinc-cadmium efflux system protein